MANDTVGAGGTSLAVGTTQAAQLNSISAGVATLMQTVNESTVNLFTPAGTILGPASSNGIVIGDLNYEVANSTTAGTIKELKNSNVNGVLLDTGSTDSTANVELIGANGKTAVPGQLLVGNAGNDTIKGNGGSGTIIAGAGSNVVDTGSGSETVYLTGGSATVKGSTGTANVFSGTGADTLIGGSGTNDFTDNGGGNVTFEIKDNSGVTLITGFDTAGGDSALLKGFTNSELKHAVVTLDTNNNTHIQIGSTNIEFVGVSVTIDVHGKDIV